MNALRLSTPARRKFLKSEGTEFAHCDDVFRRVALARPDVAMQLTHNGRVSLRLAAGRREARVRALLGDDFVGAARSIEAMECFVIPPKRIGENGHPGQLEAVDCPSLIVRRSTSVRPMANRRSFTIVSKPSPNASPMA